MIAYEIKTILYYNSIYGYGEAKPKFSFLFFVGSPFLEEQGVPIYSEEGIRLRIKFCRRKIFASQRLDISPAGEISLRRSNPSRKASSCFAPHRIKITPTSGGFLNCGGDLRNLEPKKWLNFKTLDKSIRELRAVYKAHPEWFKVPLAKNYIFI